MAMGKLIGMCRSRMEMKENGKGHNQGENEGKIRKSATRDARRPQRYAEKIDETKHIVK